MAAQEQSRVLTLRGYAILKSILTPEQIQHMRTELTVAPKVLDKFQKNVVHFPIYYESRTRYYVPRAWGIREYGKPEADIVPEGLPLPAAIRFKTTFPPHDFQREIMTDFLRTESGGLICVPCGYGKTFMALHLAVQIGRRFLVVVDKEFLMNQWRAEIANFIEGARVGILQADKCEIESDQYDITICMIQTICRRDFPATFFDQYGFTIFDECHHLGAAYFCQALKKIQTKRMLGLSATPDREDGLTRVFEAFLGAPVYKNVTRAPDREAVVKAVWFDSVDPAYREVPVNWRGEPVTAKLLNQVADFEPRNRAILGIMTEYTANSDRYLLLLSDRISQLDWFHAALEPMGIKVGYYIGGMKQAKLDHNAETCQVLLATYQMASEAFSVKKLNTVILATPRKNVQQSTGRIFRERIEERKLPPHIVDIIDSHDCHKRRWWIRRRFYKQCEYTFKTVKILGQVEESEESEEDESEAEAESEAEVECAIRL